MSEPRRRAMEMTVAIFRDGEQPPPDRQYWLTRPVEERLAAVELLRSQYHGWTYDALPRLPRLLRVVRGA